MDKKEIKLLTSRTIVASRFEIIEDELNIANQEAKYSFVRIKPGICVIIETNEGFIVLSEYRYPIKQWSYEFVAGVIDDGESPREAAIREVKEETGYITEEVVSLGEFYPSFGSTDEIIYLFYAKCGMKKNSELEITELIKCEIMKETEINNLIISGEFKHGAGLAAWLKYKLLRQGEKCEDI